MRGIVRIGQVDAMKQIAQDAPGTIFSRGVATLVSPFSTTRILNGVFHAPPRFDIYEWRRRCGRCRPCGRKERAHKGLGKLQRAQFSTAPTASIFFGMKRKGTKNERQR